MLRVTAAMLFALGSLSYATAEDKRAAEDFRAVYGGVTVHATIPAGWKVDDEARPAPDTKLLGYWKNKFADGEARLIIQSVPKIPYYVEEYANTQPVAAGPISRSARWDRIWALSEGRGTHNSLIVLYDDAGKVDSYHWRSVRVERVGRDCVAMVMVVSMKNNPGGYNDYRGDSSVKPHLAIPASFRLESK
jgi:hypothetical protein